MFKKSITDMLMWWTFWKNVQKVHHWHMGVMDFLEKCSKSTSLTYGSDGLLGKMLEKSITGRWKWWTFKKGVDIVHNWNMKVKDSSKCWKTCHWHIEVMDFLENVQKVHHWHMDLEVMNFLGNVQKVHHWHIEVMYFLENVLKVHHWHMGVMDFLGNCSKSPSLESNVISNHFHMKVKVIFVWK